MKREEHQLTTLSNGLRIASLPLKWARGAVVGTWIATGTRYENALNNGINHFTGNMFFHGTERRKDHHAIGCEIDSLGGNIHASAGYENTAIFIKVSGGNVDRGFDIQADIIRNATFLESKIHSEKGPLIQRIKNRRNDPAGCLAINFAERSFHGYSMGLPVVGTPESISSLRREDIIARWATHYTPANMVVTGVGAVEPQQLVDLAGRAYGDMPRLPRVEKPPAYYTGGDVRIDRDLQQVHACVGFQGVGELHPDAPAYTLWSQMLGGSMSAPLFQIIRNQSGLVYSISATNEHFTDAGVIKIEASFSSINAPKYFDALAEILSTFASRLTEEQLQQAKANVRTANIFVDENPTALAERVASSLLHWEKIPDGNERIARIDAVSLNDIRRVNVQILGSVPTRVIVGPRGAETYEKFADRFQSFQLERNCPAA